jgi:hypothetical protein
MIMAGMNPTQSPQISQIGLRAQLVAIFIACITMSVFGRKIIVLWSRFATGVVFVTMGSAGFYQHDHRALMYVAVVDRNSYLWGQTNADSDRRFIGVSILLIGAIAALGVGATWPVLIVELSLVCLRAESFALGLAGIVFSIKVPYIFNADVGNLGGNNGSIFAPLSFLGFGLSLYYYLITLSLTSIY